ncbi:hypothetical protein MRX96_044257 [Rhipicephalus microplus]
MYRDVGGSRAAGTDGGRALGEKEAAGGLVSRPPACIHSAALRQAPPPPRPSPGEKGGLLADFDGSLAGRPARSTLNPALFTLYTGFTEPRFKPKAYIEREDEETTA